MSTDWREKEREFLSSLEGDTGRDLAAWMAIISAQALRDKNEIIDWLRGQGFMFARASWLERIHNNGGRPIYLTLEDLTAVRPAAALNHVAAVSTVPSPPIARPEPELQSPATVIPFKSSEAVVIASPPATIEDAATVTTPDPVSQPAPRAPPATPPDAVAEVLAKAKAYRPLAAHLLRSLEAVVPGLTVSAGSTHLALANGRVFALLAVSGKDIRLAFAMPGRAVEPPLEPVKLPVTLARPAESMTHMIVLTDARQIDARLMSFAKSAAATD